MWRCRWSTADFGFIFIYFPTCRITSLYVYVTRFRTPGVCGPPLDWLIAVARCGWNNISHCRCHGRLRSMADEGKGHHDCALRWLSRCGLRNLPCPWSRPIARCTTWRPASTTGSWHSTGGVCTSRVGPAARPCITRAATCSLQLPWSLQTRLMVDSSALVWALVCHCVFQWKLAQRFFGQVVTPGSPQAHLERGDHEQRSAWSRSTARGRSEGLQ